MSSTPDERTDIVPYLMGLMQCLSNDETLSLEQRAHDLEQIELFARKFRLELAPCAPWPFTGKPNGKLSKKEKME